MLLTETEATLHLFFTCISDFSLEISLNETTFETVSHHIVVLAGVLVELM